MKLFLVQHGEATAKDVDPERPLTAQGEKDVDRVATKLAAANIRVERVIHSGKKRAQQTAEILAQQIAPGIEIGISEQINPLDDPATFDWQAASDGEDLMLVGHLPFMAKMAAWLVTDDAERTLVEYRPGSILCLQLDADGNWLIGWMLRPELLT